MGRTFGQNVRRKIVNIYMSSYKGEEVMVDLANSGLKIEQTFKAKKKRRRKIKYLMSVISISSVRNLRERTESFPSAICMLPYAVVSVG